MVTLNCLDCRNELKVNDNWYINYKEKNFYLCIDCAKNRAKIRWKKCKDSINTSRRKKLKEIRLIILKHYSESDIPICNCCNEKNIEFLTLDHPDNDGAEQRKKQYGSQHGSSFHFYNWLIKHNFPIKLKVSCWNCNLARHIYGVCPHIQKKIIVKVGRSG